MKDVPKGIRGAIRTLCIEQHPGRTQDGITEWDALKAAVWRAMSVQYPERFAELLAFSGQLTIGVLVDEWERSTRRGASGAGARQMPLFAVIAADDGVQHKELPKISKGDLKRTRAQRQRRIDGEQALVDWMTETIAEFDACGLGDESHIEELPSYAAGGGAAHPPRT